jgi:hypothetical protein
MSRTLKSDDFLACDHVFLVDVSVPNSPSRRKMAFPATGSRTLPLRQASLVRQLWSALGLLRNLFRLAFAELREARRGLPFLLAKPPLPDRLLALELLERLP